MKRTLSLLLALVMTLSLFPAGIAAAADPADVTVQAYQLAGNRLIEVDGSTDEVYWLLDTYVGSSMLGALCDIQNVYFAFKTTASTAKITVNGVTVDCTLGSAPKASAGTIAVKDGTYELAVPVSDLKLEIVPDKTVDFAAVLGADSVKGALVLAQVNVTAVGEGVVLTGVDYASTLSGESFGDGNIIITKDGVFTFKNDSTDGYYSITSKASTPWASLSGKGYVLSFEADFNDLPISTDSSKLMYNFGWFWFLLGGGVRSDMAFWADEQGHIMFCAKQDTTAKSRKNAMDTGIKLGTPEAQNVRVRILLDQEGNITLYINGAKIGSVAACPPPSTSARNQFSFYTDHRKRTSADHVVDVVMSDMSYREFSVAELKDPEDKIIYPVPVGPGVKEINAFMKNGKLKIDGLVKEAQWYLNNYPEHRTGDDAPSVSFGMLWDEDNLYIGMQDFGKRTTQQLSLTVNNKVMVRADLAAGTATAGEFFFDPYANTAEWAIPMSAIGIRGQFNEVAQYSVAASSDGGNSVLSGNLTLSGEAVIVGDTFDDLEAKDYMVTGEGAGTHLVQGEGSADYVSDPDLAGNEIHQMFKALDFEGAPYSLTLDMTIESLPAIGSSLGWRGLCFELREPKLQSRFNFRDDGKGNVVMDILYQGNVVTRDTGLKMGDRAVVRMDVDKDNVTTMYVNDNKVAVYPAQDRISFTINDSYPMPRLILQSVNYNRVVDSQGNLNEVNVQLHDMLFSQPILSDPQMRLDTALGQITEKVILGKNTSADNITTALNLPAKVSVSDTMVYPITWKLHNMDGSATKVIDLATGKINPAATTSMVELVGSVADGQYRSEVVFNLQVKGTQTNSKVYFLTNDDAPANGAIGKPAADEFVFFDTDHNSVVYDQGSAKRFNRVVLTDSDESSRVSQAALGVFISNDGKNFTKVTGWMLHQSGKVYTLYNLDETARYIKVHSYQDALNDPADTMKFEASFQNNVADLIRVEYSDSMLGAKGKFAYTGSYTASNETDKELRDEIIYVTAGQLGAKAGQYRTDCADFRFTVDGVEQPHWYDGEGGFYVRVLKIPAKGSVSVTAHWGNVTAADVSDRQNVFEAVYGNVSLVDLSERTDLVGSGRAFTFPNGTVIAVARNDNSELTAVFSYDGGRTFTPVGVDLIPNDSHWANTAGYGSYIWDAAKQRLLVVAYMPKKGTSAGYAAADCRFVIVYTDDYGKTWSDPVVLSDAAAAPATDNDIVLQNSKGRLYQLSYCDGLTLREADGAGPNTDYVIVHGYFRPDGTFAAAAIFSKDDGKSWHASETDISIDVGIRHENGLSETALAQLDDGSLYIVARAQASGTVNFYESYSYDAGNTWTAAKPSIVISTNTSPVFLPYGSDRLLMWAGNNTLGDNARRRFPMTLAISSDNYKSYDRSINLSFGTSFDTLEDSIERMTQPSLSVSADGNEGFVCWTNLRQSTTVGMLIEEFGDKIYNTKGAYDAFESTAIKGEGWLLGDHSTTGSGDTKPAGGRAEVSTEQANTGNQSMKVWDDDTARPTYVLRQIPSMRKGTVGASMYVPAANTTDFVMEIKHAFNFTYGDHTVAGVAVKPDGTVYLCDGKDTVVGKVAPDTWNDFAIEFDMEGTKKGTLYINDKETATFDLVIKSDRVTVVQIGERSTTATMDSCVYVDDFFATETKVMHNGVRTPAEKNTVAPGCFDDVATGDWYAEAVAYATEKGLMSGYNAATFGPNDTLTRAQVVQVLYNKEGTPALNGATHKFPDVPANQWFNNAVTWGAAKKVVSGYGDGRFGPSDTVTLEQAVVILWNYSGTPAAEASLDAIGAHSDWASNALRWAVKNGLLEGMPYAAVTGGATRAQTAQLLMNYLSK